MIGFGHLKPFEYTPKQLIGYTKLGAARRKNEMLENLYIYQLAAHGKKEDVKKAIRELSGGR